LTERNPSVTIPHQSRERIYILKMFSIFGWLKGAKDSMENNIDFETRFLLNIGKWLHENDYISIEEITEYENIVKKETENND
jgi:hypothetical protein